jgi:hypothetical protein
MTRTIGPAWMVATILSAACTTADTRGHQEAAGAARAAPPATAAVANVLIFGDAPASYLNTLEARLEDLGHTAVIPPDFRLPGTLLDLAQYHTIWHVGARNALSPQERSLLISYLAIGGGVHLTGENSLADSMNDSLDAIVRDAVDGGGSVVIGRQGSVTGALFPINDEVLGGIATTPNQVSYVRMVSGGGIGGLPLTSRHVLATNGIDKVVAAVWEANDLVENAGALSVAMDAEWLANPDPENLELIENLQEFLTGSPFINQPPVAVAVVPGGQNLDCNDDGEVREVVPVELDGSGSSDPDSGPSALTYTWFENGAPIGFGPNPTVDLAIGNHTIVLVVGDGEDEGLDAVMLTITCTIQCTPGGSLFTRCHPGCPCDHGEGDCDDEADCLPGLVCLHDAGFAFGYLDDEVDVCSNVCPTLGVGAWNYCSAQCPCDAGEGDCESDADCAAGLRCISDIGPAFGFQREVDICEPR